MRSCYRSVSFWQTGRAKDIPPDLGKLFWHISHCQEEDYAFSNDFFNQEMSIVLSELVEFIIFRLKEN